MALHAYFLLLLGEKDVCHPPLCPPSWQNFVVWVLEVDFSERFANQYTAMVRHLSTHIDVHFVHIRAISFDFAENTLAMPTCS